MPVDELEQLLARRAMAKFTAQVLGITEQEHLARQEQGKRAIAARQRELKAKRELNATPYDRHRV